MTSRKANLTRHLISYSFLFPYLLLAAVFAFLPFAVIIILSFTQGTLLDIDSLKWIGFGNYTKLFANLSTYAKAFLNSLFYAAVIIPAGQLTALALAFLIRRKSKANAVFETVFFSPIIISMTAAGVILAYVLAKTGPLNYVLSLFGIAGINWFGDPVMAKLGVGILEIWKGATFYTFIYIAALRNIPADYFDAAKIDGAGLWHEIWHLSLPLIKNAILLSVVMTTIFVFQIYDSIYILTGGGPLRGSESVVFFIYRVTIQDDQIGLGAAISIVFMLFVMLISLLQMKLLKSDTEY
ncbi:carbohydrate ABC transporter permease [Paenibacillus cymbidii]|uniref:carbohydrate ABC transporter permease n=1 Tax=Paenibacillus cymbidii TaxID=1639034 RepID=UPI0010805578|nr:sugar ABC transporter permease [Paenibacillus cymbidii]